MWRTGSPGTSAIQHGDYTETLLKGELRRDLDLAGTWGSHTCAQAQRLEVDYTEGTVEPDPARSRARVCSE